MQFENESPFAAELIRSALSPSDSDPILAAVVLKVTYRIGKHGVAYLADEQIPVSLEEQPTELGSLPADTAPCKPGCDVHVLGHARVPGGGWSPSMTVRLQVGSVIRDLAVFGDRYWVPAVDRLAPSEPRPFQAMPLTYTNAYGGKAKLLDYEVTNPYNPVGKGYILQEEFADAVALPNIEDPAALISTWSDQPVPAGYGPVPISTMFTVDRGLEIDRESGQQRVKPEVFQSAHPSLVLPELAPGTPVTLYGMGESQPLYFAVPNLQASVTVQLEDQVYEPAGRVDTLCIFPDDSQFFLIHRTSFKYPFVPEQKRTTWLRVESTGVSP